MGMAWTGWTWDVKFGDFLNNGNEDVVQTDGFIKGTIDRWNWLQEMAMTNDDLLSNPRTGRSSNRATTSRATSAPRSTLTAATTTT